MEWKLKTDNWKTFGVFLIGMEQDMDKCLRKFTFNQRRIWPFEIAGNSQFEIYRVLVKRGRIRKLRCSGSGINISVSIKLKTSGSELSTLVWITSTRGTGNTMPKFSYVLQKYLGCEAILGEPKIYKFEPTVGPDYANHQHSALPWSAAVQVRI